MDFNQRLQDTLRVARKMKNWQEPHFTWEKAYVASVFSLMAYEHIPAYEAQYAERAKLIPCEEYQAVFDSRSFIIAQNFLRSQEGGASFYCIEREMVVVMLSKIQNALFISLRGTQSFHDLRADFDFLRRKVTNPVLQATGRMKSRPSPELRR